MKIITDKFDGNLTIDEELSLRGMVTGDVTVTANGCLNLFGMVCGNLILNRYSKVVIHGIVCGDLINEGGSVTVLGIVNGTSLDISEPGVTA